jgi:predicted phosphodiesterase
MERTALIFDAHVPYQDNDAYYMALGYIKNLKPKIDRIVLAGDYVDFYKISFWKSDPERLSFEEEVKIAIEKLKELRQMFYRVPIDYLEGNHEQRLFRYVRDKAPELLFRNDIESTLHLKQRNINYITNIGRMCEGKQPYKLGKLFVLHGHEKKVSMNAINLARLFYSKCKTNVIAGHHHKSDYTLVKKLDGTYEGSWTVGQLGKLSEPYAPINDWNHGFAYVDVFDNGIFEVHNKIIIEGRVING